MHQSKESLFIRTEFVHWKISHTQLRAVVLKEGSAVPLVTANQFSWYRVTTDLLRMDVSSPELIGPFVPALRNAAL